MGDTNTDTDITKDKVIKMTENDGNKQIQKLIKYAQPVGFVLLIIAYIFVMIQFMEDRHITGVKLATYSIFIFLVLCGFCGLFASAVSRESQKAYTVVIGMVLCVALFIVITLHASAYTPLWILNSLYFYLPLIVLFGGLAIVFVLFRNKIERIGGWMGFLLHLVFYIPCLYADFVRFILEQINMTTNFVLALFLLELVFIAMSIYFPRFIRKIYRAGRNGDGTEEGEHVILTQPRFLNNPLEQSAPYFGVDNIDYVRGIDTTPTSDNAITVERNYEQAYRHNYTLSMWVYINPQSSSSSAYVHTNGANILTYGNFVGDTEGATDTVYDEDINLRKHVDLAVGSGNPRIAYIHDIERYKMTNTQGVSADEPDPLKRNRKEDAYLFSFDNTQTPPATTPPTPPTPPTTNTDANLIVFAPPQRWNNFVLNYQDNHVDIFVNGVLTKSWRYTNVPIYRPTDMIRIGQLDGLYGAICNVIYYEKPLSNMEIITNYNLLRSENPPINNY